MQSCLEPFGYYIGFLPVECCPKSIKTTLHWIFFFTQSCLEHLRQYYIGFSAVQCCPKSIKTTLHNVFSDAMLSEAFRITLHRAFTCAMLSLHIMKNKNIRKRCQEKFPKL